MTFVAIHLGWREYHKEARPSTTHMQGPNLVQGTTLISV